MKKKMKKKKAKKEEAKIKAEKEKKKKEIKAERRASKRALYKEQQKEYESEKHQKLESRKLKREEDEKIKKEEEEKVKIQKETARLEYAERQERKRLKAEKEKIKANTPKPQDDDRKLFVGGLNLEDLKKLNITLDPTSEKTLKRTRSNHLFKLFAQFGQIEKIRDFTHTQNHFFVTYSDPTSCQKAIGALDNYDERRRLVKEIKDNLTKTGGKKEALNAPNAHFYVRIVRSLKTGPRKREFKAPKKKPPNSSDKVALVEPSTNESPK